jgi:hypothetical protein
MVALVHKNTNVPLISLICWKTHYWQFLKVFRGGITILDPKIALRCAQDKLGVKKVLVP